MTAPIDTSTLSKYTVNDSATADLLTDGEIRSLLESSAHQTTVSCAQAQSDVDLFFRMLHSAYCAYYYFGQDKFETAEKNVKEWVAQFSTVNVSDLERKIADELSFARDAHAIFGAAPDESSTRYEYFYVKDLRLYKGEDGYYKLDNGERWYLKTISDARVTVELTLMDDGELVYAPVLLVPRTEVKSCIIAYQNEAGKTRSETVSWTESQAYSGFQTRPDVKSFQAKGIQYISVRSFMGEYGIDLQDFINSGKEAQTAKAIIFDLRGNHGGNDGYGQSWMRSFIGKEARYTVAVGNRYSKLRAAAWNEGEGLAGQFVRYEQTGTFLPNDIPIIVLVDDGCASSGESMLSFLKTMDNTIVIGTNSGGYQLCGNNISVTLPNTGIYAYFGVSLTFPFVMENVDRKGYDPDVWCSADTSLEAVLNMMVRYNVTDQAAADKVAEKAIVKYENVTLKYGDAAVRPGETCGSGQGEYVLYPMLDGKVITDYTYTMSSNGVLTHSRAADDGIKVQVVGGGYETITVTVHGVDYRFRWFSDASSSAIGEIPKGDLTLGFIGSTVKPGERFGAWKWMYDIDVLVGGQKVTDFTYTVEKDGILYHQKTRDGRIAVTVIGNGETPFIIHYNGEDYPFIWVTEGFDGDVCVPEDPENFTLEWLGIDIYPGASFGSWEGSYRLIPMLDGKPITNFTYTNADKSVIRDRLLDDGTVEVTVVGDGHAKLTFTVNGKDYSFYWAAFTP
ncbi:MAG: S41 family peptidase [Clostridiales bacterium]|nr:S41 family peptidase [Clostridiales bacterium]